MDRSTTGADVPEAPDDVSRTENPMTRNTDTDVSVECGPRW